MEYDGTRYAGSQRQPKEPTIQGELEEALYKLTGTHIKVSTAGRTDSGTHAFGQVVSFTTTANLDSRAFVFGLNHFLPDDIVVKNAETVSADFDPRRDAVLREYVYCIINSDNRSPVWRNRAYQVPGTLDVELMNEAAKMLIGTYDFASFTTEIDEGKSSRRIVYESEVSQEKDIIRYRIVANSFLRHMVRVIVGTLIRVGKKTMSLDEFKALLDYAEISKAGPVAPACGLYLNRVEYSN
jgi:tRNA pseudouridine38-40 synthase